MGYGASGAGTGGTASLLFQILESEPKPDWITKLVVALKMHDFDAPEAEPKVLQAMGDALRLGAVTFPSYEESDEGARRRLHDGVPAMLGGVAAYMDVLLLQAAAKAKAKAREDELSGVLLSTGVWYRKQLFTWVGRMFGLENFNRLRAGCAAVEQMPSGTGWLIQTGDSDFDERVRHFLASTDPETFCLTEIDGRYPSALKENYELVGSPSPSSSPSSSVPRASPTRIVLLESHGQGLHTGLVVSTFLTTHKSGALIEEGPGVGVQQEARHHHVGGEPAAGPCLEDDLEVEQRPRANLIEAERARTAFGVGDRLPAQAPGEVHGRPRGPCRVGVEAAPDLEASLLAGMCLPVQEPGVGEQEALTSVLHRDGHHPQGLPIDGHEGKHALGLGVPVPEVEGANDVHAPRHDSLIRVQIGALVPDQRVHEVVRDGHLPRKGSKTQAATFQAAYRLQISCRQRHHPTVVERDGEVCWRDRKEVVRVNCSRLLMLSSPFMPPDCFVTDDQESSFHVTQHQNI